MEDYFLKAYCVDLNTEASRCEIQLQILRSLPSSLYDKSNTTRPFNFPSSISLNTLSSLSIFSSR
jgi:hypothetical protein